MDKKEGAQVLDPVRTKNEVKVSASKVILVQVSPSTKSFHRKEWD